MTLNIDNTEALSDIVYVDTAEVQCEGPSVALGHPRIYLNLGQKNEINCPYCGRKFVRNKK